MATKTGNLKSLANLKNAKVTSSATYLTVEVVVPHEATAKLAVRLLKAVGLHPYIYECRSVNGKQVSRTAIYG